jgi:ATP synthase protein I
MPEDGDSFSRQIGRKAARKLEARRSGKTGAGFALGMFGVVGWSVALPTVAGALLGAWLDRHHPSGRSWTLALLVAGLMLGSANAWHWVSTQSAGVAKPPPNDHE